MFQIGTLYTKKDIYKILDVPSKRQRGNWDTGYTKYEGMAFIFANVGIAGRTGYNHGNYWEGENLVWFGKPKSNIGDSTFQFILNNTGPIYIFTRTYDRNPFTFEGKGFVKECTGSDPVKIIWSFEKNIFNGDEIGPNEMKFTEGIATTVVVNKYERNRAARRICIEHHGYDCKVCNINFYKKYGEIGKDFIHVHHLIPLHTIRTGYSINPIHDLIPVCPNCHAMLHKRNPTFTIDELKNLLASKS